MTPAEVVGFDSEEQGQDAQEQEPEGQEQLVDFLFDRFSQYLLRLEICPNVEYERGKGD